MEQMCGKAHPGMSPESQAGEKKVEENPVQPEGSGGGASAASQTSADSERSTGGPSAETTRKTKRPAPLPLPALALFLKQHLAKSKKVSSTCEAAAPSEPLSSPSPHSITVNNPTVAPTPVGAVPECDSAAGLETAVHPEVVQMFPEHEPDVVGWPSSPSCPEAGPRSPRQSRTSVLSSVCPAEPAGPGPSLPDGGLLPVDPLRPPSTVSPSLVSLPGALSLPAPPNPAPLLSDSQAMLPLLPDPECSSFCFDSFSPASSPEPLASLACPREGEEEGPGAGDPRHADSSIFKWHTVIPSHQHYMDTSFAFQPAPQPLAPEALRASESFVSAPPPPTAALPFQENEHSLPFPVELSPLQLPLSPTFSSLDGNALSPTPSLTDLVHFFSNDDLGMGLDFSNSEPVAAPCPFPSAAEDQRPERSQQEATKRYKLKKTRRHKVLKSSADVVKNGTYTSMQPNLEEVEEQLFVSFTSKVLVFTLIGSPGRGLAQTRWSGLSLKNTIGYFRRPSSFTWEKSSPRSPTPHRTCSHPTTHLRTVTDTFDEVSLRGHLHQSSAVEHMQQ